MINIANIKSVFRLHGQHWICPCVLDSSVHLDVTIAIVARRKKNTVLSVRDLFPCSLVIYIVHLQEEVCCFSF